MVPHVLPFSRCFQTLSELCTYQCGPSLSLCLVAAKKNNDLSRLFQIFSYSALLKLEITLDMISEVLSVLDFINQTS